MSTKPRILCMCNLDPAPDALETLRAVAEVDYVRPPERAALLQRVADCDAFWGDFDLQVDREVIDRGHKLRAICTATTGTDHIDKVYAAQRNIRILCIAEDYGLLDTFTTTAEKAWMLLLACHHRIRPATRRVLEGPWSNAGLTGHQVSTRTLGVLGVGRLGRMVVEYGKAFRMRVLGCDPKPIQIDGVEQVDFETLLAESDAISIHIHLTEANHHLVDAAALARMKDGAVIVNTSRGDIIDEQALLACLQSGKIGAFGADVLHDEPGIRAGRPSPMIEYARTHDQVVITPHYGGATVRSIHDAKLFAARKLAHFLTTGEELRQP